MKIAIVGTQNSGKSLLIKNFLKKWKMYNLASPTYRDLIKQDTPLNQLATKESQEIIRDALVEQALQNKNQKYCIHDRCVLDNLIYTLWLADKNKINDDSFITSSFNITRETLKCYDVVFLLELDEKNPVPLEKREGRDLDEVYRQEINNLFLSAYDSYMEHSGLIFPTDDCPGFIKIKGDETKGEKIKEISNYLNDAGDLVEDDNQWVNELENTYLQVQKELQKKKNAHENNKG